MPIDLSIPTTATMILWVEDPVTRDYLRAVWKNSTSIAFRLGGGNDGVRAIVKAFEEEGHRNVFGLIDRDFQPSNQDGWSDPAKTFRTFVLPVHEIENYLLDATALQASRYQNRSLDINAIENRMLTKANNLCWWASCRDVIAELKRRFREPFVPDPRQSVIDEATAQTHIFQSPWFLKLASEAGKSAEADIRILLTESHAIANVHLADGTWRREYAGKEILKDVAGWMCDRTKIPRFPLRDQDFYSDLAKGVGAYQADNRAIPLALTELRAALEARIARLA
jgi:hypothetical protein